MHERLQHQIEQYLNGVADESLTALLAAIDQDYETATRELNALRLTLEDATAELRNRNDDLNERIDEFRTSEHDLRQYLAIISATIESSQEGVLVVDKNNRPVVFNNNFTQMWNLSDSWLQLSSGKDIYEIVRVQLSEPSLLLQQIKSVSNPGASQNADYLLKDGRTIDCYVMNHDDVGLVWSFRDITEKRKQEAVIRYQAHHDALTNLPNRTLFQDRLNHALRKCSRSAGKLAIFYMDLDGFKTINDSLGHLTGDELLVQVSHRLEEALREADTVARVGGDEFIVLLEDIEGHAEVVHLAERVLDVFRKPFFLQGQELYITTSIGVAIYPGDGETEELLIRNADIAMYKAKDQGRNNFHFYTSSLERLAKHRLSLETKLRNAVKTQDFQLYYQPKVSLVDGSLKGFEALLRWETSDMGFIGPDTFIPVAEATGMILPLGQWVVEEAARQARAWYDIGFTDVYIAVNLSAKQFQQVDIFRQVMDAIDAVELPHKNFAVEITESMIMQNVRGAIDVLADFRKKGITVCMDDFGTGYSSLNYLKTLPIDILKIDRTFIKDIAESPDDRAIASSIITLGHNLGLKVVAEGVEDEVHVAFLKEQRCDIAQGYYYSKPLPAAEVIAKFKPKQ